MKKGNKLNYEFRKHFINPLFADHMETLEKNQNSELETTQNILFAQLAIKKIAKRYRPFGK